MSIRFKGFAHPLNGTIVLADSPEALAEAILATDQEIGRLHRLKAPLQERLAELQGPLGMPRPRFRTDRQSRVARCPRCSGRLDEGGEAA